MRSGMLCLILVLALCFASTVYGQTGVQRRVEGDYALPSTVQRNLQLRLFLGLGRFTATER